jgi:hypothetical protein
MKHARLLLKMVTGFFYSLVIAFVSGYIMLNEEYMRAFDEWRK